MVLQEWFNLNYDCDNGIIRSVVDREAAKCYKDWKRDLYDYFKDHGGSENESAVRAHLPKNFRNPDHWGHCCDRFMSDKFQVIGSLLYVVLLYIIKVDFTNAECNHK